MDLKDLRGRLTVVLTSELRQLALNHVAATGYGDEEENLRDWFSASESPDGTVLDAAYSEAEAAMVNVILQATLDMYLPAERCPECKQPWDVNDERGGHDADCTLRTS